MESGVRKFLNKVEEFSVDTCKVFGPERQKLYLSLPYAGPVSLKLRRQLKRMYSAVFPCVELIIIFKPASKLSKLCKLKSCYPLLSKSNVIYKVNCASCSDFYVGLTTRRLEQRLKEHSSCEHSALLKHHVQTGHTIDYTSPEIVAQDVCKTRLFIKESLKIQELRAYKSLNGNQGSFDLHLW